jgi:hypothetical protein
MLPHRALCDRLIPFQTDPTGCGVFLSVSSWKHTAAQGGFYIEDAENAPKIPKLK